jgi:hypothetical protein
MAKKTKEEINAEKEKTEGVNQIPEIGTESTWSKDQQKHDYYYDDSHGYQKYVTEDDSEEE